MFFNPEKDIKNQIKIAFVSACQSEHISEIFLNSGIPIVISVNSQKLIMDRVCKLFSRHFYRNLLDGQTIQNSFDNARIVMKASPEDYDTCCCAHDHDDDCEWYKYFQEDCEAAHNLHNFSNCNCRNQGVNGKRVHNKNCEAYQTFV